MTRLDAQAAVALSFVWSDKQNQVARLQQDDHRKIPVTINISSGPFRLVSVFLPYSFFQVESGIV